jgi:hypothetical protein
MKRAASAFAALAASCTPALAHVAPWSSPDPPPLPVQFLIGIALMAVAGAVILWQGAALARGRERRRFPVMRIALTPRWPAPMCGRQVQMTSADAMPEVGRLAIGTEGGGTPAARAALGAPPSLPRCRSGPAASGWRKGGCSSG